MSDQHVRLMHYDPRWPQEFEQTRSSILHSCAGWVIAVEHVGSTAISGLIARPTIDVVAAVGSEQAIASAAPLIEGLNFRCVQPPRWATGATVLIKPRHAVIAGIEPTHRVFLVVEDSALRTRLVRMRDWLRGNAESAIDFEEAKVACWRQSGGDLDAYQAAKARCFADLEGQIDEA